MRCPHVAPQRITAVVSAISLERHSPHGFRVLEERMFSNACVHVGSSARAEISRPVLLCVVEEIADEDNTDKAGPAPAVKGWKGEEARPTFSCCCAAAADPENKAAAPVFSVDDSFATAVEAEGPGRPAPAGAHAVKRRGGGCCGGRGRTNAP